MTSSGSRSDGARSAQRSSKSSRKVAKKLYAVTPAEREAILLQHLRPMLELFAEVDDVFSEDDALAPAKRQMGMGRLYRAWKKCRSAMDPQFDALRDNRDRRDTTAPTMRTPSGEILSPRRKRSNLRTD